jgi:hypothetical protein
LNRYFAAVQIRYSSFHPPGNEGPSKTTLTKNYEYFNIDACEKDWRFRKFRVVTVVRTADKMYNPCKLMSDKFSHRMFWMTTDPLFKEGISGESFRTPRDYDKVAYSFLSP